MTRIITDQIRKHPYNLCYPYTILLSQKSDEFFFVFLHGFLWKNCLEKENPVFRQFEKSIGASRFQIEPVDFNPQ